MKVLFYTYPVAFVTPGGGEIQLLETKKALQNLGVQVDMFDIANPNLADYDVLHTFSVQAGVHQLHEVARRYDIRIVNSPIMWIKKGAHKYCMHNLYHVMNSCDLVLPNSIAEKNCFLDFYDLPDQKYHVTYNGIDPEVLTPVSSQLFCDKFGFTDKTYLLCVGNIEPRKNQYRIIEAANRLNLPLVLIGHVRDQNYYNQCKSIMTDNIRYVGALPHNSDLLKSAYTGAKIHICAGLLETPGLVSLEAATLGTPIVSTNEGSAHEYFLDLIQYCDPLSVDSISEAIRKTATIGVDTAKLQSRMTKTFTWDNTAKQTLAGYEKVLTKETVS